MLAILHRWNQKRLALAHTRRGNIAEWVVTLLILIFTTTTLAQAFVIPSSSMEDTLMTGDHVIVDKLTYSPSGPLSKHLLPYQQVQRGDIIVFRYPVDISKNYVKRVIGIPGDHIRIADKQLILNGHSVTEPYKFLKTDFILPYRDNFPGDPRHTAFPSGQQMILNHVQNGELIVPPGHYFAMGDNRDYSEDSRYWGFVPRENIIGKPVIVYWSYESTTERLSGSPVNPDHLTDLALNFFSKTRWNRTFRLVRGFPLQ
jgi:signal peptidase I